MRAAKTQFSQNVELEITYEQQLNYHPPQGINIYFYDREKTEKPKDRVNATFFSTSINNKLNSQKYLHDINAELNLLGKYVKKDHLKKSDEPQLVKNPKVKTESILDEKIFNGERDKILSRARERHRIKIKKQQHQQLGLKDSQQDKNDDYYFNVDFGKITEDY